LISSNWENEVAAAGASSYTVYGKRTFIFRVFGVKAILMDCTSDIHRKEGVFMESKQKKSYFLWLEQKMLKESQLNESPARRRLLLIQNLLLIFLICFYFIFKYLYDSNQGIFLLIAVFFTVSGCINALLETVLADQKVRSETLKARKLRKANYILEIAAGFVAFSAFIFASGSNSLYVSVLTYILLFVVAVSSGLTLYIRHKIDKDENSEALLGILAALAVPFFLVLLMMIFTWL
jgi:uncharacterized membrane protein HdeD (DUF308 family)